MNQFKISHKNCSVLLTYDDVTLNIPFEEMKEFLTLVNRANARAISAFVPVEQTDIKPYDGGTLVFNKQVHNGIQTTWLTVRRND